jgi:hypothetical protein
MSLQSHNYTRPPPVQEAPQEGVTAPGGTAPGISAPAPVSGRPSKASRRADARNRAVAGIVLLAKAYPKCFAVFERRRKPIKIGIRDDILAKFPPGKVPKVLSLARVLLSQSILFAKAHYRSPATWPRRGTGGRRDRRRGTSGEGTPRRPAEIQAAADSKRDQRAMSNNITKQELIVRIKTHIAKGDQAAEKSEQHYVSAGQYLKSLKEQHAGSWAEWEELLKTKVGIGKSRASVSDDERGQLDKSLQTFKDVALAFRSALYDLNRQQSAEAA